VTFEIVNLFENLRFGFLIANFLTDGQCLPQGIESLAFRPKFFIAKTNSKERCDFKLAIAMFPKDK